MKMKYLYISLLALLMLSCSRHQYKTMSSGKEDTGFVIVLTENGNYTKDVALVVDNGQSLAVAKVYKQKMQRKAPVFKVEPGKHNLKVVVAGRTVYDKDVIIGLQETRKIVLP